jgi:hypothetical protein
MDSSPAPAVATAPRRHGAAVTLVVILFLLLLVVIGRWLSPNLNVGTTVADRTCENLGGYCIEHVTRGEWVFLAPVDEWHVLTESDTGRYYTANNPFAPGADVSYGVGGGVSVTDGTITLTWNEAVLARLGD